MMVRWEEPEEPNGQIKGYRVYYTMDDSQPMAHWQIHNVQDSMITTIQSLVPSETYTIKVLAFTSVGDGPFSEPIHVKVLQGGKGSTLIVCCGVLLQKYIRKELESHFYEVGILVEVGGHLLLLVLDNGLEYTLYFTRIYTVFLLILVLLMISGPLTIFV